MIIKVAGGLVALCNSLWELSALTSTAHRWRRLVATTKEIGKIPFSMEKSGLPGNLQRFLHDHLQAVSLNTKQLLLDCFFCIMNEFFDSNPREGGKSFWTTQERLRGSRTDIPRDSPPKISALKVLKVPFRDRKPGTTPRRGPKSIDRWNNLQKRPFMIKTEIGQ